MRSTKIENAVLLGIIVLALLLRIWGIRFGLPYEYHPDENQYIRQAATMGEIGLEPTWWNNPPLYKYVYLAEFGGLYVLGKVLSWYDSPAEFGAENTLDPTKLHLIGRATTAAFGILTVLIAYWLGKNYRNRDVGLISAAFLALAFIHVRDSHYAVNDIPLTLLVTLATLAAVRLSQTGRIKWYMLGGIALGLGFSTKYSGLIAIVPLTVGHILSADFSLRAPRKIQVKRYLILIGAAVLSAIISSPYYVLTPAKVWNDVYQFLYLDSQRGFFGFQIDSVGGFEFYLKTLVWGLGLGLLLLVISGIALAAIRHKRDDLILLSLPVSLFMFLGQQEMFFARFILPAVPVSLVLGAYFLQWFIDRYTIRKSIYLISVIVAVVILSFQPLSNAIRHNYILTKNDTRSLAKEWIESNLPSGSKVAVEWKHLSPPLSSPEGRMIASSKEFEVADIQPGIALRPFDWYVEQEYEYLVFNSYIWNIPRLDQNENSLRQEFYYILEQESELLMEFNPYQDKQQDADFVFDEIYGPAVGLWQRERPGPVIKVYGLN